MFQCLSIPAHRSRCSARWLGLSLSLIAIALTPACGSREAESDSLWTTIGAVVSPLMTANPTPINTVLATDPAIITGTETAYIAGEVVAIAPLVNGQMYQIRDRTGQIWVVTGNPTVRIGDRLVLEGLLQYESVPLANQEQGDFYLQEQERLEQQSTGA